MSDLLQTLRLVQYIAEEGPVPGPVLQTMFRFSRPTLYRRLDQARHLGAVVAHVSGSGFEVRNWFAIRQRCIRWIDLEMTGLDGAQSQTHLENLS